MSKQLGKISSLAYRDVSFVGHFAFRNICIRYIGLQFGERFCREIGERSHLGYVK